MANNSVISDSVVLEQEIRWDSYLPTKILSENDVKIIKRADRATDNVLANLVQQDGAAVACAYVNVLKNISQQPVVNYALVKLKKFVYDYDNFVPCIFEAQKVNSKMDTISICQIFVKLLRIPDWFTQNNAAIVLASILQSYQLKSMGMSSSSLQVQQAQDDGMEIFGGGTSLQQISADFIDWLAGQLQNPTYKQESIPNAFRCLSKVLNDKYSREHIVRRNYIPTIVKYLVIEVGAVNLQIIYDCEVCIWQISYIADSQTQLVQNGVILKLTDILKSVQKDKCVRVALLCIKNLLNGQNTDNQALIITQLIDKNLPKIISIHKMQSWGDEDIPILLQEIDEKLKADLQILSTWDKYVKQVEVGRLEWGHLHGSEEFWKENSEKLCDKDYAILRKLINILLQSKDDKSIAVSINDLSQFITYYPQGRGILIDFRIKETLISYLAEGHDATINKQALLCLQKIMLPKDKVNMLQRVKA